jgi:hypothetical protein
MKNFRIFMSIAIAILMLSCGGDNKKVTNTIREKEEFPKQLYSAVHGVIRCYGDTLPSGFPEYYWQKAGIIEVTLLGEHKNLIGTKESFFGITLTEEGKKYLVDEATWKQGKMTTESYEQGTYGSQYDQWMIKNVPESARELPKYLGVVSLGTIDIKKVIEVEKKEMEYGGVKLKTYEVKWEGEFTEKTPFAVSEPRFYDAAANGYRKSEINYKDGKVDRYKSFND